MFVANPAMYDFKDHAVRTMKPIRHLLNFSIALLLVAAPAFGQATQPAGRNSSIEGQLIGTDGKPVEGVRVCLSTWRLSIWTEAIPSDFPGNPPGNFFSTTDSSGHFSFPGQKRNYTILAFTDSGYVIAKAKQLRAPFVLRLTRWAKLEGSVTIGGKATRAGIHVEARYNDPNLDDELGPWPSFDAATDDHGHFIFGRVLAGKYSVSRVTSGPSRTRAYGAGIQVEVKAGDSKQVEVPVIGPTLVGRIAFPTGIDPKRWTVSSAAFDRRIWLPQIALPQDILRMTPSQRLAWFKAWEQTGDGKRNASMRESIRAGRQWVDIDPNGSFRIEDAATENQLIVVIFAALAPDGQTDFEHSTRAAYPLAVSHIPSSADLEATDVGTLQPQPAELINSGQLVPEIAFPTLKGADMTLSQFKGKTVLLEFWGIWCGVCLHDLPKLKAIYDLYGSDPRFAMISLSVGDERPNWQGFVRMNHMQWIQGFLGDPEDAWPAKLFCVSGYPSYWLLTAALS